MEDTILSSENGLIICPFGKKNESTRNRSDRLCKEIIMPVFEEFNYATLRADKITKSGMITPQVIEELIKSPLVVADLTEGNPNVFYELAIRHAMNKPCILMQANGSEDIPFYFQGMRIIYYGFETSEEVEKAKKCLREYIRNMNYSDDHHLNPIILAYSYKSLIRNLKLMEHGEDDILSLILGSIGEFHSKLNEMDTKVSNLNGAFSFLDFIGLPNFSKTGSYLARNV